MKERLEVTIKSDMDGTDPLVIEFEKDENDCVTKVNSSAKLNHLLKPSAAFTLASRLLQHAGYETGWRSVSKVPPEYNKEVLVVYEYRVHIAKRTHTDESGENWEIECWGDLLNISQAGGIWNWMPLPSK